MKDLIQALERPETYFGMVQQLAVDNNCTLKEAWQEVELLRENCGLSKKYRTYDSFKSMTSRNHNIGMGIERFEINPE